MDKFETGATRDSEDGKLDYEGFESPLARWLYASYMHKNRVQKDGTYRASDNWQLGIPKERYFKSMVRHMEEARNLYRGWLLPTRVGESPVEDILEVLCAVRFNLDGFLHESAKEIINLCAPLELDALNTLSGGAFSDEDGEDEQPTTGRSADAPE